MRREPVIHSLITDQLPEDHPLAFEEVFCSKCDSLVHFANNECMTMWVEDYYDHSNEDPYLEQPIIYCLECYIMQLYRVKDEDRPQWLVR